MHLLNQRKIAPAIARPPSGPSTCASLDGYDQRDAGGPITICHPVTGEAGWVPGNWTVLSVTPGTASAYGNPYTLAPRLLPPGPSFGLDMMLADFLRLIVLENGNVHAIDVAWL